MSCALDSLQLTGACCRGGLVEGHCCIVPSEHAASSRTVDDDTWTEMRNFKKSLITMARAQARPPARRRSPRGCSRIEIKRRGNNNFTLTPNSNWLQLKQLTS